jgi:hypothetical protein
VLNRAKDQTITEINYSIFMRNLKEEFEDNPELELKNMEKKGPGYYNELNLDSKVLKDLRGMTKIKARTGTPYIPMIWAPETAIYHLNIGATPFRNGQAELRKGLLRPWYDKKLY